MAGTQLVHQLENASTAARNAGQWIIGYDDWQAGLLGQELIDVAQQRATTGENDAPLGDIGPEAAMPVMEGKAMLFKEFAGVDAFPLCLDTKNVDEIVAFVRAAAKLASGWQ